MGWQLSSNSVPDWLSVIMVSSSFEWVFSHLQKQIHHMKIRIMCLFELILCTSKFLIATVPEIKNNSYITTYSIEVKKMCKYGNSLITIENVSLTQSLSSHSCKSNAVNITKGVPSSHTLFFSPFCWLHNSMCTVLYILAFLGLVWKMGIVVYIYKTTFAGLWHRN